MKNKLIGKNSFKGKVRKDLTGLLLLLSISLSIVGVTLAFFFASDWSSSFVQMSGAVNIEAVGKGNISIEDTIEENNVVISHLTLEFEHDNEVLIPGMGIDVTANVKVYKSNTSPLIRAKFELLLYNYNVDTEEWEQITTDNDELNLLQNVDGQCHARIVNNHWYKFTDGYYYYRGNNAIDTDDAQKTKLMEVDVTDSNQIVPFLDTSPQDVEALEFPTNITSEYSALGVRIQITFEAIQNFIPGDDGRELFYEKDGEKINNTIEFSKIIFDQM